MTARELSGVFAPITTPFDPATGEIAAEHLRRNVARLVADGLDGIVVAGSTGEAPLLDPEEQRRAVAWTREALANGAWLLVGTGGESTRQTIALTKAAAAAGADAVLVRPPSYYGAGHSTKSIANHFRAVADASPIPILVYNIPKYTHLALPPDLLAELATHGNVVGAKDSSGDFANLAAYREAVPNWSLFVGSASLLYRALEVGCDGGILAVACFAPRICADLLATFRAADRDAATALQARLAPLDKEINGKFGPAGVKVAMDAAGLYGGPVRAPLAQVAPADRERIVALVRGD